MKQSNKKYMPALAITATTVLLVGTTVGIVMATSNRPSTVSKPTITKTSKLSRKHPAPHLYEEALRTSREEFRAAQELRETQRKFEYVEHLEAVQEQFRAEMNQKQQELIDTYNETK